VKQLHIISISLVLGVLISGMSVAVAWGTLSSDGSDLLTVLLWNFYFAGLLINRGVFPVCPNCELVTLFEIIFWAFIVGGVGYTSIFFGSLQLHNKLKKRSFA